jgi:hypothetical protein
MSDFNPLVKDTAELTLDQMLLYSCTAPSPASLAVKSSTPYIMFSTSLDKMSDVDDDSQAYLSATQAVDLRNIIDSVQNASEVCAAQCAIQANPPLSFYV